MRILAILLICGTASLSAAPPITCKQHEIAFVVALQGPWIDAAYNRPLSREMPVCSDSTIIRLKSGAHAASDSIQLKDPYGGSYKPFHCADLLNCEHPIDLAYIREKTRERLKGKPLPDSIREIQKPSGGASTISNTAALLWPHVNATGQTMRSVVLYAGKPIQSKTIWPNGYPKIELDLCLNAHQVDCAAIAPSPKSVDARASNLPFGSLPPGLHLLYETRKPSANSNPLRTGNVSFVLAANPAWSPSDLDAVSARLTLAFLDSITSNKPPGSILFDFGTILAGPPAKVP